MSKTANASAPPPGGAFVSTTAPTEHTFVPEDLPADAHLMGKTMDDFVRREVVPVVGRLDAQGTTSPTPSSRGESSLMRSLVQQAGQLGLLAAGLPRRYGGLDLPKTTTALLAEKSAVDLSFAITISVHSGVGTLPLLLFGTNQQRDRYLPSLASGDIIAAFALSEGNSGSDALAAQARAIPSGDGGYLLDGTKLWVTNGGFADLYTVFAQAPDGFTAFLVPRDSPGLSLSGEEQKMGLRGSSTRRVFLNNVVVSADSVLGEVGRGHRPALYALNAGRFNIGAIALGGAKEALRISTGYALQRRQSGRPIAEFGLVGEKLAEMTIRIYALESMVYRTAGYCDAALTAGRGLADTLEEYAVECAIVKFFGTEVLGYAVDECLQIHGGFGFSEEFPAARLYRDARVFRIFEGTNEINRLTVVDQLRRRIERGRLPAITPAPAPDTSPTTHLRAVAQFVLAKVTGTESPQSAVAASADIVALLYAVESISLRIGQVSSPTANAIVDAFTDYALGKTADHARTALGSLGVMYKEARPYLDPLMSRAIIDTAGLKRSIAGDVRDCGGYPI